jgi:hypothetical protein
MAAASTIPAAISSDARVIPGRSRTATVTASHG